MMYPRHRSAIFHCSLFYTEDTSLPCCPKFPIEESFFYIYSAFDDDDVDDDIAMHMVVRKSMSMMHASFLAHSIMIHVLKNLSLKGCC